MHDLQVTANEVAAEKIALEERLQEMERRWKREQNEKEEMRKQHTLYTLETAQRIMDHQEAMDDFKVQYPSWWDMERLDALKYDDVVLMELPLDSAVGKEVVDSFKATAANNVVKVEGVMNRMLYDRWWNEKRALTKSVGTDKVNERNMFHGARTEDTMQIVIREGFRKVFNKSAASGYGTYLAKNANYSVGYSAADSNGIKKMFRCNVLCGESHIGNAKYTLTAWPKKANGLIYDSLVNGNVEDPTVVVIHENARIYPMFIIHFQ